jgi:SAM-dependent methyltransferase
VSTSERKRIAGFGAADEALVAALHALDDATNYRDWIFDLARPHLMRAERILEVGAGSGTFTELLAQVASSTLSLEPGPSGFAALSARFSGRSDVEIVKAGTDDLVRVADGRRFGAAFLSNVLEHIEDDVTALDAIRQVLRPGGRAIVFSPAFDMLYSRFDATVGHHHRYRRHVLAERMRRAGFDVVEAKYVNSVGFFTWLGYVRLLGRSPADVRAVRAFDRLVVPGLRAIEARLTPSFGQSVLVVGERPREAS